MARNRDGASERYPPIGDYALIGDCHSAALVSRSGSIDWCCMPRMDAGAVFARLLDWERGGHCAIEVAGSRRPSGRRYVGDSMVLETEIDAEGGRGRLIDLFPMRKGGA